MDDFTRMCSSINQHCTGGRGAKVVVTCRRGICQHKTRVSQHSKNVDHSVINRNSIQLNPSSVHRCMIFQAPLLFWLAWARVLGTPMSWLIIHLPCFDPCALFSRLVFCSVSSLNWCVQLNVGLGPNALRLFECHSLVFLCLSAPSR